MLYAVGTKIDLQYLNSRLNYAEPESTRPANLYEAGTRISFIKMTQGLILTKITEPSLAIRVAVGA